MNTLQRKIMRRIYYAYAIRLSTHTITLELALFVVALYVFAKMVFVQSVIDNLMATPVGNIPTFVMSALMQGEVLTLIAVGAIVFTFLSVPLQLRGVFRGRIQRA